MPMPSSTNRIWISKSKIEATNWFPLVRLLSIPLQDIPKIKSLDELKDGSQVAVPNDPTNLGRSLLLLQKVGLIKLKDGVGLLPTSLDIVENPKNLKIVELEAPQLPRSLDDAQIALAVINTTYASQIGLTPAKDGIFVEDKDSPYVNLIVTREDNKDAENVKNSFRLISLMKCTKPQIKFLMAVR